MALQEARLGSNLSSGRRYMKEIDAMREVLFVMRGYKTIVFRRVRNDPGGLADTIFYVSTWMKCIMDFNSFVCSLIPPIRFVISVIRPSKVSWICFAVMQVYYTNWRDMQKGNRKKDMLVINILTLSEQCLCEKMVRSIRRSLSLYLLLWILLKGLWRNWKRNARLNILQARHIGQLATLLTATLW